MNQTAANENNDQRHQQQDDAIDHGGQGGGGTERTGGLPVPGLPALPEPASRPSAAAQILEYEGMSAFDWSSPESAFGTGGASADDLGDAVGGSVITPSEYWPTLADADRLLRDSDDEDESMEPLPFDDDPLDAMDSSEDGGGDSAFGFARSNYMDGIRAWSSGSFLGAIGISSGTDSAPAPVVSDTPPPSLSKDDLPGMVRSTSGSLSSDTSGDEAMSDDDSSSSSAASTPSRGVTFNEQVRVLPIPPLSSYTIEQRRKMYANRFELRENKVRNKKEYEFDGYDWRNATEEGMMAICPVSGELLHPAHL